MEKGKRGGREEGMKELRERSKEGGENGGGEQWSKDKGEREKASLQWKQPLRCASSRTLVVLSART